jgi:hypothetical protein
MLLQIIVMLANGGVMLTLRFRTPTLTAIARAIVVASILLLALSIDEASRWGVNRGVTRDAERLSGLTSAAIFFAADKRGSAAPIKKAMMKPIV